jgi:putative endonuclease
MYYVYFLKSKNKQYFYTGYTSDLKHRIHEHNCGEVTSTKPYYPFILIYYEACLNQKDAYLREKYLKSRLGKTYLRRRLKNWYSLELE